MSLLDVEDLSTTFRTDEGVVEAVDGVDLTVEEGETVGIVGESGSGKSVTALSIMGLVDDPGEVTAESIEFRGEELRTADERRLQELRGDEMSMIFQDPMESLNPVLRVGEQIAETLRAHGKVGGEGVDWLERSVLGNFVPRRSSSERHPESWGRAVELMEEVGIPEPGQRASEYPHQFSGGMQQRAMIAMALACDPDLLVADEPTTALDVTIQAQILNLLENLQAAHGMSILLITHDLGVIVETCDKVAVMYAGEFVETGTVEELFSDPKHPYTRGLLRSIPRIEDAAGRLDPIEGQVPDLIEMDDACYFAPRCAFAHGACYEGRPPMYDVGGEGAVGHEARCVLYDERNPRDPPTERPDGGTGRDAATDGGGTDG